MLIWYWRTGSNQRTAAATEGFVLGADCTLPNIRETIKAGTGRARMAHSIIRGPKCCIDPIIENPLE
jgi:hypothetical protein